MFPLNAVAQRSPLEGIRGRQWGSPYLAVVLLAAGAGGVLASTGLGVGAVAIIVVAWVTWSYPQVLPALLLVGTAFLHALTFVGEGFATRGDIIASPLAFLPVLLVVWGPPSVRALLRARTKEYQRTPEAARRWLTGGMTCLLVWLALRWVDTPTPVYGATKILGFAAYSFMPVLLILLLVRSSEDVVRALRAILMLGGIWLVIMLSTAVIAGDLNLYHRDPGEIFGSTNLAAGGLGARAAMVALVALGTLLSGRRDRLLSLIFLALGVAAAVLAGHRGSLAGLIAGATAFWLAVAVSRRARAWAIMIPALVIGISVFVAWRSAPGFIKERYVAVTQSASLQQRRTNQAVAMRAWVDSPFVGHGTGSSGFIIAQVDQPRFGVVQGIYPHNVIIELLAETGLVGLGLYLVPVASVLAWAVRRMSDGPWFLPVLFALVVHAFVLSQSGGDLTLHNDLWILLGLLAVGVEASRAGTRIPKFSHSIEAH